MCECEIILFTLTHSYEHTYIHTYIHTYTCVCGRTYWWLRFLTHLCIPTPNQPHPEDQEIVRDECDPAVYGAPPAKHGMSISVLSRCFIHEQLLEVVVYSHTWFNLKMVVHFFPKCMLLICLYTANHYLNIDNLFFKSHTQSAANVALNFAMPWPPHTTFVSHLGHPSKNIHDMPLLMVLPVNDKHSCPWGWR